MNVVNAENAGAVFRQRKVSKKNPPDAASSCALTVLSGFAGGFPIPPAKHGIPAVPLRAIPYKTASARRGHKGMGWQL